MDALRGLPRERFPDLQQFMTTWEDQFDRPSWEGFLTAVGYHKTAPAAFVKLADHRA